MMLGIRGRVGVSDVSATVSVCITVLPRSWWAAPHLWTHTLLLWVLPQGASPVAALPCGVRAW